MRVLIFEPQFKGHNLCHVARLVRELADLPCELHVATSIHAAEADEFQLHLGDQQDRFETLALEGFQTDRLGGRVQTNGVRGWRSAYGGLKTAIDRLRPDHVYVLYGNHLARIAASPFGLTASLRRAGAEAETLLIGGKYCYPQSGFANRLRQRLILKAVSLGPWRTVFHFDDLAIAELQNHGRRVRELFRLAPDPHGALPPRDRATAREAVGLPVEGRLLGVVGLIEPRKGIDHLATALRDAGDRLRPDDRLVLMGRFDPDIWSLLNSKHADLLASGRVLTTDRLLTNEEMTDAVSSLDVVSAFYPHHRYTSSVLATAAMLERPVLGARVGWIGRMTEQFDLGVTCDPAAPAEIADRMVDAFNASDDYRISDAGRRFVDYVSEANFAATMTARLRERMGVPPSPALRSWAWAVGEE